MGEATAHNALEDWIAESTTEDESKIKAHVSFPADDMLSLYLQTVGDRPEREVKELLWRMFTVTTSKADADTLPLVVRSAQKSA